MSLEVSKCYKLLSTLLQYPRDIGEMRKASKELYGLVKGIEGLDMEETKGLEQFVRFLEGSHLWTVQEEYVNTFDLFPLCPPYISHHIYGESYRKGEYMVRLIEIYREYGFEVPETLKSELPDHISVITQFLGFLELNDRRDYIEFIEFIITGLKKMADAVRDKDTPYRPLILLIYTLCLLDCESYAGGGEKRSEVENTDNVEDIGDINEGGVIKCWTR
jgi:nitrate reductase delta subunit